MPCDSRTVMHTVYKPENLRFLLRAASALGWKIVHASADGELVAVETPSFSTIEVTGSGRTSVTRGSEQEAGLLMQTYAREVFEEWAASSPDTYEEIDRETGPSPSITYNLKTRGGY